MMPVPGGHDAQVAERGLRPAQQLVALAVALVLPVDVERERARPPHASICTEWSMTRSAGTSGLTLAGSPPRAAIASRIAARSTTAGRR